MRPVQRIKETVVVVTVVMEYIKGSLGIIAPAENIFHGKPVSFT